MSNLEFMWHLLSVKGIEHTQTKVEAVTEARQPESASEVRSFLGYGFQVVVNVRFSFHSIDDFNRENILIVFCGSTRGKICAHETTRLQKGKRAFDIPVLLWPCCRHPIRRKVGRNCLSPELVLGKTFIRHQPSGQFGLHETLLKFRRLSCSGLLLCIQQIVEW